MLVPLKSERGATAIFLAIVLVLLMGMAAIAVDLAAGWNERRQDQTAADLSVMAAATENVLGASQQEIVEAALEYARQNLDTTYSDTEWEALWEGCADPEGTGFDLGAPYGVVNFQPLENLDAWAADGPAELACISSVSNFLRVRIPNQTIGTSFARVIGFDQITTHADAVALMEASGALGAVIPFGIPGGTANGELCLKSSGSGTAIAPCQGPSAGGFGEINSELFGVLFGSPHCGNPGHPELSQNIALGIDHAIAEWDGDSPSVSVGSPHPGDSGASGVESYDDVGFDACTVSSGVVEPQFSGHVSPPNTVRVGTGFSPDPVETGLVSDSTFLGEPSRLQQGDKAKVDLVKKQTGANKTIYRIDNEGIWDYLNSNNSVNDSGGTHVDECDGSWYNPSRTLEEKVAAMDRCLAEYDTGEGVIFSSSIEGSPRLVWAPEYWHAASTSGLSWQPVLAFRLVFLAGTYWNCSGTECGAIHYPDKAVTDEVCDLNPSSGRCQEIRLDQLSAFLLPFEAVPEGSIPPVPGTEEPSGATLFK